MAYAASGGHLSVCKALVKYGADPQTNARWYGAQTLLLAGKGGHLPVVKFLVELVHGKLWRSTHKAQRSPRFIPFPGHSCMAGKARFSDGSCRRLGMFTYNEADLLSFVWVGIEEYGFLDIQGSWIYKSNHNLGNRSFKSSFISLQRWSRTAKLLVRLWLSRRWLYRVFTMACPFTGKRSYEQPSRSLLGICF